MFIILYTIDNAKEEFMIITKQQIDELLKYKSTVIPVTSVYLNVDPAIYPREEYMKNLKTLIRQAKENVEKDEYSRDARFSLMEDFEKILNFVEPIKEHNCKSLAIFSSSKNGFFQTYELDDNLKDMIVTDYLPYTKPLFAYLRMIKRYLAILSKSGKLRAFEIFGSNIQEELDLFKRVKYPYRPNNYIFTNEKKYYNKIETEYRKFLREASEEVLDLFMGKGADFVTIGGDKVVAKDLYENLHPYLKERFVGFIDVDFEAKERDVLEKVRDINRGIINKVDDELIEKIKEELAKDGKAVKGLKEVLNALTMAALSVLAVEEGYMVPGFLHKESGFLYMSKDDFDGSPDELIQLVDIVNEAIDEAINQGTDIRIIRKKGKMDELDHIAGLLRFKLPQ